MLSLESKDNPFDSLVDFIKAVLSPTTVSQRQISDAIRSGFSENFEGEKAGNGAKWKELHPLTKWARQKRGFPVEHPILVRTGSYRYSFVVAGATNHIEELQTNGDGWELTVGSSDPRKILEIGGNTVIEGHLVYVPPRPVTVLSTAAQDNIANAIVSMIAQIEARTLGS